MRSGSALKDHLDRDAVAFSNRVGVLFETDGDRGTSSSVMDTSSLVRGARGHAGRQGAAEPKLHLSPSSFTDRRFAEEACEGDILFRIPAVEDDTTVGML